VTENSDVIDEGSLVQLAFIHAPVLHSTTALHQHRLFHKAFITRIRAACRPASVVERDND
jgi:hypothetical protein